MKQPEKFEFGNVRFTIMVLLVKPGLAYAFEVRLEGSEKAYVQHLHEVRTVTWEGEYHNVV